VPRPRTVSVAHYAGAAGALGVAWCCARAVLASAWGLPAMGPGSLIFVVLLAAGAWALVEEPTWSGGGATVAARWLAGGALLAAGEAFLYYPIAGREGLVGLGFGAMASGAWLLWPRPAGSGRWAVLAGAAAMLAAGVSARHEMYWDLFLGPGQAPGMVLVFWAGFAAAAGGLAVGAAGEKPSLVPGPPLGRRWEAGLLGLVLLAAAALRFYQAARLPAGYWVDEVTFAQLARDQVLGQGQAPLYAGDQAGAYLWVCAALFKAFGPGVETLRLASGAFGLLALLPFWGLARLWLGQRWALAATLAFGAMRWVAIPQRTGFMSAFALFWMLAAFWALWNAQVRSAVKPGRAWPWLLAGFLVGANLHTYTPGRAVPWLCLAFLLIQGRLDPAWRRPWRDWLWLGLGFALSAGPMLAYGAAHWQDYSRRPSQASVFNPANLGPQSLAQALWSNLTRHALMFQFRGDFNGRHNLSGYPQLDYLLACAAAPALPWTLGRAWRDARGRFLWLWLAAMLAAGILSLPGEAPQANRCILAAPALALAVAWCLRDLSAPLGRAFEGGWPATARALGLALLLGLVALNAVELLGRWPTDPATLRAFCPRGNAVMARIQAAGPGASVYVSRLPNETQAYGQEWQAFAAFTLGPGRLCKPLGPSQSFGMDGVPQDSALLIWGQSDPGITAAFRAEFPDLPVEAPFLRGSGPGNPDYLYLAATVPAGRIPAWDGRGPGPLLYRPF
jgi:4-amino-4-deoxy-L-arabinose transferase-like glycosyltransferase